MRERVIGVAGIPGAWSSQTLAAAFRAEGAASFVLPLSQCVHDLAAGKVLWEGRDLSDLDAVVVKKLGDAADPHAENCVLMLKQLEEAGVLVVSAPHALYSALNRYRMSWLMRQEGIPMPRTVVADTIDGASAYVEQWGRAVLKPLFTSKGRDMELLSRSDPVRLKLRNYQRQGRGPFYLQEYVPNAGRDIAVPILGGRVLGAYYRVASPGQWQTTTAAGGHYESCRLSAEATELALAAAAVFGLDFTCVDMVESDAGLLVYEVSAFGGFSGLREAAGIDAPALLAGHVLRRLDDERA